MTAQQIFGLQVLLSFLVYGLVAQTGEFVFEPPREVELKGVEGPQRIYPLAVTA